MSGYRFAAFTLELATPLHLGCGRVGMLARSHAFVPGHVIGYALAAQLGRSKGGKPEDFQAALCEVAANALFAPAFILDRQGRIEQDWPQHPERYLSGDHHVTLHLEKRSAVESALFEVEYLAPRHLYGPNKGQPIRLGGGLWLRDSKLAGRSWREWLEICRLGGELKSGYGIVRCTDWQENATTFHGWGRSQPDGLHLSEKDSRLWGPSLDTITRVGDAPLLPWTGRRYDFSRGAGGFGQRIESAVLVRLNARINQPLSLIPSGQEGARWGCWELSEGF
ncbi:MAG: hypothetical protein PHE55_10265 [Methylococcaceae bacterium]|nr:hypothetical protein [Methylococcaceae bacterium]